MLFVLSLILGGIGIRRLRSGTGAGLLKATMMISLVLLAAFVVAAWAMSAKPDQRTHRAPKDEAGGRLCRADRWRKTGIR